MLGKPRHLAQDYAEQFQDESVVAAYHLRPSHSPELFGILGNLIDPGCPVALDIGCGEGSIARPLSERVRRVDAIDFSANMIAKGKTLPGGDRANIKWVCAPMEEAALSPPYGLVTAGDSLHWMDWATVMPRLQGVLTPNGNLAIIERKPALRAWPPRLGELISRYSSNRHYQPFDLVSGLAERGLFEKRGEARTKPFDFCQSIADYVESYHSQNGFSRDRMTPAMAAEFDKEAARALRDVFPDGVVKMLVSTRVTWGYPVPPAG